MQNKFHQWDRFSFSHRCSTILKGARNVRKVLLHRAKHNARYENELWHISLREFFAVLHDRSKLFLSLRPIVPILKMRGKKEKRISGSMRVRKHPSGILNSLVHKGILETACIFFIHPLWKQPRDISLAYSSNFFSSFHTRISIYLLEVKFVNLSREKNFVRKDYRLTVDYTYCGVIIKLNNNINKKIFKMQTYGYEAFKLYRGSMLRGSRVTGENEGTLTTKGRRIWILIRPMR